VLFVRQKTLFAQNFDPLHLILSGDPFPVAANVWRVASSAAGPIAFRAGTATQRQLEWFDRSGNSIGKVGEPDLCNCGGASISPDGRYVALNRSLNENIDIWLLETATGAFRRFTFDPAGDSNPIWSPDGSMIVFQSQRKLSAYDLYQKPVVGTAKEELLLETPESKQPTDWSPDGRFLLYRSRNIKTGYDLWVLRMDGSKMTFPVVQTSGDEREGQFSPDGKWIAYQSNESGRSEIYVQPFPGPGGKEQVSTNGGAQVLWRHDGKELFYIGLDDRLMAAPIQLSSNPQAVEVGAPVPLFATHIGAMQNVVYPRQYVVSADGKRFLMNSITQHASATPITVILNWKAKP
jgi:Tol biopolymer transport system component